MAEEMLGCLLTFENWEEEGSAFGKPAQSHTELHVMPQGSRPDPLADGSKDAGSCVAWLESAPKAAEAAEALREEREGGQSAASSVEAEAVAGYARRVCGDKKCYGCGSEQHLLRFCPRKAEKEQRAVCFQRQNCGGETAPTVKAYSGKACWICQSRDHLARSCDKKQEGAKVTQMRKQAGNQPRRENPKPRGGKQKAGMFQAAMVNYPRVPQPCLGKVAPDSLLLSSSL